MNVIYTEHIRELSTSFALDMHFLFQVVVAVILEFCSNMFDSKMITKVYKIVMQTCLVKINTSCH